ncbi:MAG: asparagine synthase (glutamine-hydrolyzing) [Acidobacteria bacterium RIFCSPLOWO2_12_FULL_67_14]|nr:MAG: asparagine synthase (glutamine-hydrolyzing) [Acidobacteria bacterium RIFCSPLOWO2_02_FULL_67_21]OFW38459.1 MAG: asparagine synthase (glutamine-hydrolyzing) [Acidobacteria bacterium RIFCSPLOWO2_12_FULL_67_14]
MCAIAGIVASAPLAPDAQRRAADMRDVMTHRGPDGAGLRADSHAILAHRRLSIIDLAGGHQPLSNEDGSVWVSFNGEIYNHRDIRADLELRGHRYRTRSDTETIVHAYEEWGDECVHRFRGMFAFAIWDAPRRRLLLVRDRLGVKPLYWARAGDTLLFASEIKGILASGLIEPRANEAAVPELLAMRYTSGDATLFHGVRKLLPGHRLIFEDGRARVEQYWDLPLDGPDPDLERLNDDALVERFRALLQESVRLRLMSDVPLGAFLSGGIDSAVVTSLMAREMNRPVETFSVAFADRQFSELTYARQAARAVGAAAREVVIDDKDFFGALPRLVWHEDEPIAHPSSVPLHFVSALAREHVKVVLTGEGSDELLAGYGKYPRTLANWSAGGVYERLVPGGIRSAVAASVLPRVPGRLGRIARRSFLAVPRTPGDMYLDNFAGMPLRVQRALLQPSFTREADPYADSLRFFNRLNGHSSLLDRMLYTDMKTYLVELLMKQDQMSMSTSIESRVPFLDHVLVEFAARLPHRLKLNGLTTKRILRKAAAGLVPAAILTRRKMGFPVPFAGWVGGRWNGMAREVLLDRRTTERGVIDGAAVARLLDDHRAGRCAGGDAIWALLNLELWYRTFIDRDGVQTLPAAGPLDAAA